MDTPDNKLEMKFDGTVTDRKIFLKQIRKAVMAFTGEIMTLDAIIHEIAKNIFDHAEGKGSLIILSKDGVFEFTIRDDGQKSFEFGKCINNSTAPKGNGVNFGIGLEMIQDLATAFKIDLQIDTSKGFKYSGVYDPKNVT